MGLLLLLLLLFVCVSSRQGPGFAIASTVTYATSFLSSTSPSSSSSSSSSSFISSSFSSGFRRHAIGRAGPWPTTGGFLLEHSELDSLFLFFSFFFLNLFL